MLRWLVLFGLAALDVVLVLTAIILASYVAGLGIDVVGPWTRAVNWWSEDYRWVWVAIAGGITFIFILGWLEGRMKRRTKTERVL